MSAHRRRLLQAAAGALLLPATRARAADLTAVVAAVKPSVLPVGTYKDTDNPRFGFRGTGFVIGDGSLVATCWHVLPAGADTENGPTMVALTSRTELGAIPRRLRVVATDRVRDLALLRFIDGPALPALKLGDADSAREGQDVALMGYPIAGALGFAPVTHRGIVASLTVQNLPAPSAAQLDARAVNRLRSGNFQVLQLDAIAYPGNSGGPLFDAATGSVIGVINMVKVKTDRESAISNPTGITYAVPVVYLHELLQEIRPR